MQHEVDQLLSLYEQRCISRRTLVGGLAALALSSQGKAARDQLVTPVTVNCDMGVEISRWHVTAITDDL